MPTLTALLLLFAAGVIAGGLRTARLLAASRRTVQIDQAVYVWSERPLSSWRYEPYSAAAILVHTLAVSVVGVAALGAASNPPIATHPLVSNDLTATLLGWVAQGGSISLTGYFLGSLVAFPLTRIRMAPATSAITEEGMIHGSTLLPWRWFSRFSLDKGILRLYSAFSPDLASFVSRPATSVPLEDLRDTLAACLSKNPRPTRKAWYRSRHLLIPTMILVCLPFVVAGWLATQLTRELALFTIAFCTAILSILGGRVITLFGFGILSIRVDKPQLPPAT